MSQEENNLEELFVQWFRLCYGKRGIEIQALIEQIAPAAFGRENQKNMLRFGLQVIRDCLTHNASASEIIRFESKHFEIAKMASILNISPDSVKTARHRLRKKLQLSTEENLTDFILSV